MLRSCAAGRALQQLLLLVCGSLIQTGDFKPAFFSGTRGVYALERPPVLVLLHSNNPNPNLREIERERESESYFRAACGPWLRSGKRPEPAPCAAAA